MIGSRPPEDQLRAEYFELLPDIRRALLQTETLVRHSLLDLSLGLERYERLLISSRIKECESAVDSLRRRQPFAEFDSERADGYSLSSLPDLAAIRVMAFPRDRLVDAHLALKPILTSWTNDPVWEDSDDKNGDPLAFKYFGRWDAGARVSAEIQIVPALIGAFWETEHSVIYKPNPNLRGVAQSETMKQRRADVYRALRSFEAEFEATIDPTQQT